MFIKYFNKTSAIEDGTYYIYFLIFNLQIALLIFVLSYYVLNCYIDIVTKQYVTNTQKLHHFIYFPCVTGHFFCLTQKILLIIDSPAASDVNNNVFYTISLIRAIACFPGFFCLSAFVAERWFATYFLDDYERNQRSWLVLVIISVIYSIAIVTAINFHHEASSIPQVIVFLSLCFLAYLGNYLNFRLNRKYYFHSQQFDGGGYSLTQRFQISENIKFSFFFNQFAKSIALFTIVGPVCLLIDSLEIPSCWKNLNTIVFDTAMACYAIVTPYVIYYHNPKYQAEFRKIRRKILCKLQKNAISSVSSVEVKRTSLRIRDTFGNQMVIDRNDQTNTYFGRLRDSWR